MAAGSLLHICPRMAKQVHKKLIFPANMRRNISTLKDSTMSEIGSPKLRKAEAQLFTVGEARDVTGYIRDIQFLRIAH